MNKFQSIKGSADDASLTPSNAESSMLRAEIKQQEESDLAALKSVSTLDSHCIRWMNKRKTGVADGTQNVKLPPDKARQLREVFAGLDFNGGGSVDITEFKAAIAYVNSVSKDGSCNFGDERQINTLFRAMDADGSGDVDFGEFMSAMTGQLSHGIAGSDRELEKLNSAFFDFAKIHRRQNLLDKISSNMEDDGSKSRHFYRLFGIQHVTPEEQNHSDIQDLRVLNRLLKVEKKALGKDYWENKRRDALRARQADLGFEMEKKLNKKKPVRMRQDEIESYKIFERTKNNKVYLSKMSELKRSNTRTFLPKLESVQTSGDTMRRRIVATKLVRSLGR
jgi:Ca2+-binding EF-hand superfamily protein